MAFADAVLTPHMPAYAFEALDPQGQTRQGVLEADSAKAARGQLRAQALVPLQVTPLEASSPSASSAGLVLWNRPAFGGTGLAVWTRQLAGLVGSGLTLERALTALMEEAENERQRRMRTVGVGEPSRARARRRPGRAE